MTTGKLAIFIIFSFMLALAPAQAAGEDIGQDVGSDVSLSNWIPFSSYSTTTGSISLVSMSDSTLKYCPPVIWNSGTAIIDLIKIDLQTPQTVEIIWFLDDAPLIDYHIAVPSSPYLDNSFTFKIKKLNHLYIFNCSFLALQIA